MAALIVPPRGSPVGIAAYTSATLGGAPLSGDYPGYIDKWNITSDEVGAKLTLRTSVLDAAGKSVGRDVYDVTVPPNGVQTVSTTIAVTRPVRWDMDRPYLYSLASEVLEGGKVVVRGGEGLQARVSANGHYASMDARRDLQSALVPAGLGEAKVVVMDGHFNVFERTVNVFIVSKAANPDAKAARIFHGLATGTVGN